MFRKIIIIYIIIGSLEAYSISPLGSIIRLISLSAIGLMIAILIFNLVYFKTRTIRKNFAVPIYIIFGAVFVSMFTAFFAFNQSFLVSLYAQRDIYFYLFYFTLHVLKVEKKELQRLIIYFGLLYFVLYLLQFFAYPAEILDVGMREERGTIRIYMEGSGYAMISYFMCLHIFYLSNKAKYLFLSVVFLIPVILFGARSGLSTLILGTLVQLLFSRKIKSKALIVMVVSLAAIPTFLLFKDVFLGLFEATQVERTIGSENVRILAAQYFLTSFLPNDISYITGIGAPSERSSLGQMTRLLSEKYGYYLVDIGIIGNYVYYGVFFIGSVLWSVYKIMFMKLSRDMVYIKYFFFFLVFLLLPIAAGFAFAGPIATICCIFYLADISHFERLRLKT